MAAKKFIVELDMAEREQQNWLIPLLREKGARSNFRWSADRDKAYDDDLHAYQRAVASRPPTQEDIDVERIERGLPIESAEETNRRLGMENPSSANRFPADSSIATGNTTSPWSTGGNTPFPVSSGYRANGQDARTCIGVEYGDKTRLRNGCSFPVAAIWCETTAPAQFGVHCGSGFAEREIQASDFTTLGPVATHRVGAFGACKLPARAANMRYTGNGMSYICTIDTNKSK